MAETEHEPEPELEPDETFVAPIDEPDEEELEAEHEAEEEHDREHEAEQEASSTAIVRALEREHTRHANAVAKALGVERTELYDCPTCEGVGFTPEPLEPEPELVQDPYLERCERCGGTGEVKTGAARVALWKVPCMGCAGSGYVTKPEQPTAGADYGNGAPGYAPPTPAPVFSPADAAEVADLRAKGYTVLEPISVPPPALT
jgi:hypothetical protein